MFLAYQTTNVVFNLENGYSAILEVVVEPLEENCKKSAFCLRISSAFEY